LEIFPVTLALGYLGYSYFFSNGGTGGNSGTSSSFSGTATNVCLNPVSKFRHTYWSTETLLAYLNERVSGPPRFLKSDLLVTPDSPSLLTPISNSSSGSVTPTLIPVANSTVSPSDLSIIDPIDAYSVFNL
jgi:hypothetical protein